MAVIKKIKIPGETLPRDIGVNSSNVIYDGDSGTTTTLNSKIQSIFTAIGDINSFEIALVNALPTENIDDHTIYFVPNSQDANTRDEYMYVGNQWEMIGSTTIDLSDYPTYDDITITQGLTTGIPAATITVGATTTTIYSVEDVDEKLKTEILPKTGSVKQVILGNAITTPQTKYYSSNLGFADTENNKSILIVGQESSRSGQLRLKSGSGSSSTDLVAGFLIGGNNTVTLPNTSGTLALTTDIPSVTVTQGITTGITIGSIDVSGTTTVFYAPESKDYIVTFTSEYDSENDEYIVSCDKSINEIVTKYNNGYNISAKYYTLIGQLAYVEQNDDQYNLSFLFYDVDDSSAAYKYIYMYTEDGDDIMSEENLYFPSAPESEFIKLYDQSSLETLYNNRYKYVKWECTADEMNYMLIHDKVVSGPNGNTTFVFLGVNKVVSVNDEILTTLYTRTINYNTNTYESIKNNTILSLSTKTKPYANQVQADWNMSVQDATAYIRNKPTKLSQFTNDTNFINFNSATETFDLRYIKIRGNDYKNGDLTFADIDSPKQITISNDAITFSLGDSGAFTTSLSYSDIRRTTPRLTFGRTTILNMVSTPEEPAEAANKQYVDDQISSVTATIPSITATAGLTTGVTIGAIDINGVTTTLYAPSITEPVQSDWTQATTTSLDYIKNKPAVWDSEDYTVPSGQTYGNSDTKAQGAVALNLSTNNAKGNYSVSEGYQGNSNRTVKINGFSTTLPYGASGDYSHAEGQNTIAFKAGSHSEGNNTVAYGITSHAEGYYSIASGDYSHAEGQGTAASNTCSHAEGESSVASGASSHAEGYNTRASGNHSHAEGYNTISSGTYSHVEGYYSTASGSNSHAEGYSTIASGSSSHAEGIRSIASGDHSHAEGEGIIITAILNAADANSTSYTLSTPVTVSNSNLLVANHMYIFKKNTTGSTTSWSTLNSLEKITARTISGNSLTGFTVANTLFASAITTGAVQIILPRAKNNDAHVQGQGTVSNSEAQHVSGKWNIQTDDAEVIGNGTDDLHRSNIRTLDWSGNEWLAGKLTVGATPTANMDVTTKQYVDSAVAGASGKAYTLSMTGPTINLLADGVAASTITLPIYDGTII